MENMRDSFDDKNTRNPNKNDVFIHLMSFLCSNRRIGLDEDY